MSLGAVHDVLREHFPQTFTRPVPLKVGIREELEAMIKAGTLELSRTGLGKFLQQWTRTEAYLVLLKEGAVRVDLQGEPSGTVTAREVEGRRARLRRAKQMEAKARKRTGADSDDVTSVSASGSG